MCLLLEIKWESPKAGDPPELGLAAVRMELSLRFESHQLAEQNGNVNVWLLEIHLRDTDNKEDIRTAETVSDLR